MGLHAAWPIDNIGVLTQPGPLFHRTGVALRRAGAVEVNAFVAHGAYSHELSSVSANLQNESLYSAPPFGNAFSSGSQESSPTAPGDALLKYAS